MKLYVMSKCVNKCWLENGVCQGCKRTIGERVKPMERTYKYDVVIPLYTAPPKREPFGPEERQRLSKAYSTRAEQVAFEEGIIFAKILYSIGDE